MLLQPILHRGESRAEFRRCQQTEAQGPGPLLPHLLVIFLYMKIIYFILLWHTRLLFTTGLSHWGLWPLAAFLKNIGKPLLLDFMDCYWKVFFLAVVRLGHILYLNRFKFINPRTWYQNLVFIVINRGCTEFFLLPVS